jgi:hypothetical protein
MERDTPDHVIDTNVLVVANGRNTHATIGCQRSCADALVEIQGSGRIALDHAGEILAEYSTYCAFRGAPGIGDEFFRWVMDNQYSSCTRIKLSVDSERGYIEFPNDPSLTTFDLADRKFIAVALSCSPTAIVLNAVDPGYRDHQEALSRIGIRVNELCQSP